MAQEHVDRCAIEPDGYLDAQLDPKKEKTLGHWVAEGLSATSETFLCRRFSRLRRFNKQYDDFKFFRMPIFYRVFLCMSRDSRGTPLQIEKLAA